MITRKFGNTGLDLTLLGYGAMALRNLNEVDAGRILNAVLDAGINFIDTAPDYGPSEDYIGNTIAHRRSEFILATKCGCNIPRDVESDAPNHIWTGAQVQHNIEHSLKRLKTDYVDIWQIHSAYPEDILHSDVLEKMHKIKKAGKVRHIAVSFAGASEGRGYAQMKPYLAQFGDVFEAMQVWYSPLERSSEQLITTAAKRGIGTIIRGATRRVDPWTSLDHFVDQTGLRTLMQTDETAAQFTLRFTATHPNVDTIIVGTSQLVHLEENLKAMEMEQLSDDVYAKARTLLDTAGITPRK